LTPEAKSAVSDSLVAEARRVLAHAHAPYSRFPVGAALLTESGKVFTATNVENASFGLSVCAERSAVFAAVAAGERRFSALAVVTDTPEPTPPCGACRQVLREFVEDLPVALAGRPGTKVQMHRLSDLLPQAFSPPIDGRSFTA
jgi:cytidine deaminase